MSRLTVAAAASGHRPGAGRSGPGRSPTAGPWPPARAGMVARGLVYLLIGVLAVEIAAGRSAASRIGAEPCTPWHQPPGSALLVAVAVAASLGGYALWRLSEVWLGEVGGDGGARGRLTLLGRALVRGVLVRHRGVDPGGQRRGVGRQRPAGDLADRPGAGPPRRGSARRGGPGLAATVPPLGAHRSDVPGYPLRGDGTGRRGPGGPGAWSAPLRATCSSTLPSSATRAARGPRPRAAEPGRSPEGPWALGAVALGLVRHRPAAARQGSQSTRCPLSISTPVTRRGGESPQPAGRGREDRSWRST